MSVGVAAIVLKKIVSGGQTGVDQAALRVALEAGLAVGGWCPPGRVCDGGHIPAEFPLIETPEERSPCAPDVPRSLRTKWNVRDSDATLILRYLGDADEPVDPGTAWTAVCAATYGRPLLVADPRDVGAMTERIADWLAALTIRTLNVAGPSEKTAPGIGAATAAFLISVFLQGRNPVETP